MNISPKAKNPVFIQSIIYVNIVYVREQNYTRREKNYTRRDKNYTISDKNYTRSDKNYERRDTYCK